MTAVQRKRLRYVPLIAAAVAGLALGFSGSAQASDTQGKEIKSMKNLSVQRTTTEQVKARAAADRSGTVLTLQGAQNSKTGSGIAAVRDVTCFLGVSNPFGGGAPTADVLVDGIVICDDFVDAASLEVQLFRDNNLVVSDSASFPFTTGIAGRVGIPDVFPARTSAWPTPSSPDSTSFRP